MDFKAILVIIFFLSIWIGISTLVGLVGKKKRIGFWGAFFVTLFTGLLIGLIVTLTSPDLNQTTKIIRCDGCKEIINGEYIAIRPKELNVKLDYCNVTCRDSYHAKNIQQLLKS